MNAVCRNICRCVATGMCAMTVITIASAGVVIDGSARLPVDERQVYARYVRFRPGDGQEVTLNPPRFSWPYIPGIAFTSSSVPSTARFTLQISSTPDFADPEVEIQQTDCNFYNFLPELKDTRKWFWRVGYKTKTKKPKWSGVRSFTIAKDAVVWDRSEFADHLNAIKGHPRILFNRANKAEVLALREKDEVSGQLGDYIIREADRAMRSSKYKKVPEIDAEPGNYMGMSAGLVRVGFAYLLTGDDKYAGFKERLVKMASWPRGGESSPEGLGHSLKWNTHVAEHMGLLYDWFYDEFTRAERKAIRDSIEWRIDWTLNDFAWRKERGTRVHSRSISAQCSSHAYQNILAITTAALAICDESDVARKAIDICTHYIVGISNGHGEDEGWMDGAGYGNGKMKWLTDATWCLHTAVPELELGKNEAYRSYMDFFARLTPIGAEHTSFGNRGFNEKDWSASRIQNSRRVAMLCGDENAMHNWIDTNRRFRDISKSSPTGQYARLPYTPYIDYVMPYYAETPRPEPEKEPAEAFFVEGWACAATYPPSDYDAQNNGVSMIFVCRPRGGTGHSFRCENAFDLHAYGETIAAGGGSTSNLSDFANATMSHNTVLVNGIGQIAASDKNIPICGRIIAGGHGKEYAYCAGDATPSYGEKTGLSKFVRHAVFVDSSYFVFYDELEMKEKAKPAAFQWLYHVPQFGPIEFDKDTFTASYGVDDTRVAVSHIAHTDDLSFDHYRGAEGMVNRITGKDYRKYSARQMGKIARKKKYGSSGAAVPDAVDAHHIWIANKTPRRNMNFLAAIVPYRDGEKAPVITRVNDAAVKVVFRGKETVISFDPKTVGDITIDAGDISAQ